MPGTIPQLLILSIVPHFGLMCNKRLSIAVVVVAVYAGLVVLNRPFIAFGETVLTTSSSVGAVIFGIIRLTHNGCGL